MGAQFRAACLFLTSEKKAQLKVYDFQILGYIPFIYFFLTLKVGFTGYMQKQLTLLINLAAQDGVIDDSERKLLHKIGASHGMTEPEIEELIKNPKKVGNLDDLNEDERFDCLYNLVHLMKVDGQIFDEEISYCMNMAKKLHYPLEAVMELYSLVHANVKLTREINSLKSKYTH